jgi:hypothetical protein
MRSVGGAVRSKILQVARCYRTVTAALAPADDKSRDKYNVNFPVRFAPVGQA